jgi:hypothetical protein
MFSQLADFYPHRRNSDGSFDSICLNCFATLANATTESDLLEYDQRHICLPATDSQRASARRVLEGKAEPASAFRASQRIDALELKPACLVQ